MDALYCLLFCSSYVFVMFIISAFTLCVHWIPRLWYINTQSYAFFISDSEEIGVVCVIRGDVKTDTGLDLIV